MEIAHTCMKELTWRIDIHYPEQSFQKIICPPFQAEVLTGCVGARPHNLVKPAQFRTILKDLLKNLIKSGISIDYQDF